MLADILAKNTGEAISDPVRARLNAALPHLTPRAKTLLELANGAQFLVSAPVYPLTEPKAAKLLDNAGVEVLAQLVPVLEALEDWSVDALETAMRSKGEELGLGFGKIAQPLRVALTGSTASPGIFDVMVILGREESLSRLRAVPRG